MTKKMSFKEKVENFRPTERQTNIARKIVLFMEDVYVAKQKLKKVLSRISLQIHRIRYRKEIKEAKERWERLNMSKSDTK